MNKKAQAAMEFLMTYGWAILVVLIAIGALAYFGVLNPGRFLPTSCTFSGAGLACGEFKVSDTLMELEVQNGLGKTIDSITFTLLPQGSTVTAVTPTAASVTTILQDGGDHQFDFALNTDDACSTVGQRFKAQLSFTYQAAGESMEHTVTGDITTRCE